MSLWRSYHLCASLNKGGKEEGDQIVLTALLSDNIAALLKGEKKKFCRLRAAAAIPGKKANTGAAPPPTNIYEEIALAAAVFISSNLCVCIREVVWSRRRGHHSLSLLLAPLPSLCFRDSNSDRKKGGGENGLGLCVLC